MAKTDNSMITKPTIVITSLGRTGTKFFSTLFREIILDATSLHEPDVFHFGEVYGFRDVFPQIRESGIPNCIRKALGKWSLIKISDARFRGQLDYTEATLQVLSQRKKFVSSRSGRVYIESNAAYYGLIDILKNVYEHHRGVYLIRDGRNWIRSWMNWEQTSGMYNKGKVRSLITHTWPEAPEIHDDPYKLTWRSMSRFERLCWAWARLNEYALKTTLDNPNARVFRFEDIFASEDRYQHLADLVQFATNFPHTAPIATGSLEGWLDKQAHKSNGDFPDWQEWSEEQRQQFRTICGPLMQQLGYEFD